MGDQCYLDDWPDRFEGVVVLEHVGAGLGPWNHDQYRFTVAPDGSALVDDLAVVFYHFHSFTIVHPDLMMPVGTAYRLTADLLRLVFIPYAEAIRQAAAKILAHSPSFRFGISNPQHLNQEQTLMAKPELAQTLVERGVPQQRSPLTPGWDIWASQQMSPATPAAVKPTPSKQTVSAALQQGQAFEPLVTALRRADAALLEAFAAEDRTKARAIMLSIIAQELEKTAPAKQLPVQAVAPTVAPEPEAETPRVQALTEKIRIAVDANDLDTADAGLRELLSLLPSNADVRITAAHLAMRRGNLRTAQDQLLRASLLAAHADVDVKHDVCVAFIHLARSWQASNEPAMARLNAERGLRMDPDNTDAKSLLASLDSPAAAVAPSNDQLSRATPAESKPTVSVIVLCFNGIEDTKKCLPSVVQCSTVPYELIVVDNASTDGTADYVREFCANRAQVRFIRNRENLGYAGGNNVGMAAARGEYVVMLNNDTIVTSGWLEGMLDVFAQHPKTGIVGPRSNYVTGPQVIKNVPYTSEAQIPAFARQWAQQHKGKSNLTPHVIGFCMMASKKLIDHIGGLDTRFGRGNFEDNDFCWRARIAGFDCRVTHEVFVHHEGHKSFMTNGVDLSGLLETNWDIMKAKWGIDPSHKLSDPFPAKIRPPLDALRRLPLPELGEGYRSELDGRWLDEMPRATAPQNVAQAVVAPASAPVKGPAPIDPDARAIAERDALFDQAERAVGDGEWRKAGELFDCICQAWPSFAPAFVGLASTSFALGEIDRGAGALDRACELEPSNTMLHVQRGIAMAHAGKLDRARECFAAVLARAPENIDAMLGMAQIFRKQRKYIDAVEVLERAHARYPEDANIIGAIGGLAAELGDKPAAERALATLQRMSPNHPQTSSLKQALAATAG
jgi:GT2 family glycosyltransferase/Tfp pilus assembly protein PilF